MYWRVSASVCLYPGCLYCRQGYGQQLPVSVALRLCWRVCCVGLGSLELFPSLPFPGATFVSLGGWGKKSLLSLKGFSVMGA